jgi:hypothetical protein
MSVRSSQDLARCSVALAAASALLLASATGWAQEPLTAPQPGQTAIETPPIAPPDAPDRTIRRHDGFYFRIGLGPGYAFGKYEPDGADELDVSGGGGASEIAFGGTIAPGLVLGGGIWGMGTIETKYKNGSDFDAKAMNLGMLGPFIDYYFNERSGGHLTLALGFGGAVQPEGEDIPDGQNFGAAGFGALIGGGYEWWIGSQWSMGVIARVQGLMLQTETEKPKIDGKMWLLSPALLFGVTYH